MGSSPVAVTDQKWLSFCLLWTRQTWPFLLIFTNFRQVTVIWLRFGKTVGCEKQSKPFPFDKNLKNHAEELAQVISDDSTAEIKNWVPKLRNKTSRVQFFISFCNMFFWFVRQNKICMITKKYKMFYKTGEISFKWLFFWQYCQKPYLEPNQKSMVKLLCKIK